MPRDLNGKELLARHTTNVDRTVLCGFADLAERLGFERQELERQKSEKQKQEKLDQGKKAKLQQARRTQTRKDQQGRSQRLKLKKIHQGRPGGQTQEREEWERSNLEDERRLEGQQRIRLDELLDMVQDTDLEPREDIQAKSSKPRFEETSNNTTVHINFKIRDRGI